MFSLAEQNPTRARSDVAACQVLRSPCFFISVRLARNAGLLAVQEAKRIVQAIPDVAADTEGFLAPVCTRGSK